jgi:glycosyltransferase involved in cell wall biosynthesis
MDPAELMRPVTFLIPDLGFGGHAKQVSLLAPALKAAGRAVSVFSLNGDGPFGNPIRSAGIAIEGQHGRRPWDLADWFKLRRRVKATRDGLIHVFGASALRSLHFATLGMQMPPIVVSLSGREDLGQFDRWIMKQIHRVLVPHEAAAVAVVRQGLPSHLVSVVRLAIGEPAVALDREHFQLATGVPADVPLIVTAGRMETRDDLFGAVWAFEFVRYANQNICLLVVGDGPGRAATEAGARGLAPEGSRVHFLGMRTDCPGIIGMSDFVVAPHLRGGANAALDAMAAGKAVIGSNTPDLADVVVDGDTGTLVPPGFAYEMARSIRRLIDDPEKSRRFGAAGQVRARHRHSVASVLGEVERIYGG